jgi:excinuclease UvrABC ATPase subunit
MMSAAATPRTRSPARHAADGHDVIRVHGARVNNLKDLSVEIPKRRLMVFTDWIIDLGPGAGHDGGRIVFEGTPADLVAARSARTGEHPAAYVGD